MNKKIYTIKIICLWFIVCFSITSIQAQNVLKVQSGAVISFNGGAVITLNNMDLDNDGTISQSPAQGSFVFNGNADNIISGTATPMFDILQIAKTGTAKISLQQGIQIGSGISFSSGIIDLNMQNIMLEPTALLNGESEYSYITGATGGYVQILNTMNAPTAVNSGNLGAVITSTQNLGLVTIRRGHQAQKNASGTGNSIFRYYDITPVNNTALNATLRFNYFDAERNGLKKQLSLWTSSDALHWANLGFVSSTSSYVEQTGINSFQRFTLTDVANALPLIWGSFNTKCFNSQTRITWETQQEQNTASFIVRRSKDGITWTQIASVPAAGNSNTPLSYSYTDPQPPAGKTFYQLLQRDMDGRQTFSPVLINQCEQNESIKVYPNPVQNECLVSVQAVTNGTATMRLYDNKGSLLQQKVSGIQAGNNQFRVQMNGYAQGIYSLVITTNDGNVTAIKLEKY